MKLFSISDNFVITVASLISVVSLVAAVMVATVYHNPTITVLALVNTFGFAGVVLMVTKLDTIHAQINSRMDELLRVTRMQALAEGAETERDEVKARAGARKEEETPRVVSP